LYINNRLAYRAAVNIWLLSLRNLKNGMGQNRRGTTPANQRQTIKSEPMRGIHQAGDRSGRPAAYAYGIRKKLRLIAYLRGFREVRGTPQPGDVVVIQAITGHPHGHMAMFDGQIWISDFRQMHGFYPAQVYRTIKPAYQICRHD